ncbi:MAG: hypothetical protein ACYSXF_02185 [Planctomycetota bacterium]
MNWRKESARQHDLPTWDTDARHVASLVQGYLAALDEQARRAPKLTRPRQILQTLARVGQWIRRKFRELIQSHWDIGVFDVTFGSLKAFLIYPGMYFAGLLWAIPVAEAIPLNTQLWTAGYLFLRRHVRSAIGRFRYGHSLNRMDTFRDEALRIQPRDARNIHRLEHETLRRTVRIRRNRLRHWMRRLRGKGPQPNVVLQSELRRMISDKAFVFAANELRNNAYLYEAIAIRKILSTPEDRPKLLARLVPEAPPAGERERKLLEVIGETLIASYARVIEQGNSLTATLKENLGHKCSATSLALRWLNWSYQRAAYKRLGELDALHYRLLADLLDGKPLEDSEYPQRIRQKREEIHVWMERATRFGDGAKAATSKQEAHAVIRAGLAKAQSLGRTVRLARIAYRFSPSARRGAAAK